MTLRRRVALATSVAVLAGFGLATPKLAKACGGFFSGRAMKDARRPSLAYEQTLIVYDADSRREHFVREVVFRTSREPFGFVVPTPSRPEVKKLAKSPFAELRRQFPFMSPTARGPGSGKGSGQGFGRGAGVTVLEVKKVGSFTAFVLAADDEKALADWLAKQHLVSTPEADVWLRHYVKMHFFYVAMRYDPPAPESTADADALPRTKAETIAISFDSPLAYYPYYEPDPSPEQPIGPRLLEVWLATRAPSVPVAAHTSSGKTSWVRPFAEGKRFDHDARAPLAKALHDDASLLFDGDLVVQRFMDQKRSRKGFGDVLFVPAEAHVLDGAARKRLEPLLPILDPSLEQP